MKKNYLLCLVILLNCYGCNQKKSISSNEIVANFDGGEITLPELDNTIKNQLYEQLFGVYYVRKLALDELMAEVALNYEAEKKHITKENLLASNVYDRLSLKGLELFCKENDIKSTIQDPNNPFNNIKLNTKKGEEILWQVYQKREVEKYYLGLMKKYNFKSLLSPPLTPKIQLDSIKYISEGKNNGRLSIWIMSDFDCESCQTKFPLLKQTFERYKNRIEFRYSSLTDTVGLASLACECAEKQGEFLNMYNYIFESKQKRFESLVSFMESKNKNTKQFEDCINNPTIHKSLNENLNRIKQLGILYTPSIFIDDRLYYGQLSEEKLFDYIDKIWDSKK